MKRKMLIMQIVLVFSLMMLSGKNETNAEQISLPVSTPEVEAINRIDYWDAHPEEDPRPLLNEAYAAARVADAVCPNGSTKVKAAIIQCTYNRSLAVGFPSTIEEVANQPYQWEGLNSDTQPSIETKELAKELIAQWRNGEGYIIPVSCVFMTKEIDGLYFRSSWDGETERIILYER